MNRTKWLTHHQPVGNADGNNNIGITRRQSAAHAMATDVPRTAIATLKDTVAGVHARIRLAIDDAARLTAKTPPPPPSMERCV